MPAIVLIVALVFLPLIAGGIIATTTFKSYRRRRLLSDDVERAQNTDITQHANDHGIVMRNLEGRSGNHNEPLFERQVSTVTTNVAPVVKPLKGPYGEIKGVGGGFVDYYGTGEDMGESGGEKSRNNNQFEDANLYSGPTWGYKKGELEQSGLHHGPEAIDIPAPKPVYTNLNYGRYNSTESPRSMMYGDDAKAADAWDKFEKRESLVRSKGKERALPEVKAESDQLPAGEFEDVDLNRDSDHRREAQRPATPVAQRSNRPGPWDTTYAVGSDSSVSDGEPEQSIDGEDHELDDEGQPGEMEELDKEEDMHTEDDGEEAKEKTYANRWDSSPLPHPYISRLSMAESGATSNGSSNTSFDSEVTVLKPASHKSSWSIEASHTSRDAPSRKSSMRSTRNRLETPSRTQSTRDSAATPTRNSSRGSMKTTRKVVKRKDSVPTSSVENAEIGSE